jgi:hypothetical protein
MVVMIAVRPGSMAAVLALRCPRLNRMASCSIEMFLSRTALGPLAEFNLANERMLAFAAGKSTSWYAAQTEGL